jgi:surfeit locus 1 family protein
MSAPPVRRLRAGVAVPMLFALAAFVTFIGLGTWQIQRKAWKEALIDVLERRLSATPAALPARERWAGLDRIDEEFRRVRLRAEFQPGRDAVVYAGGSALRPDVKAPGYFVFAPARTSDGGVVAINRGFVPEPRRGADGHVKPAGWIDIVGVLRWPESAGWFVREYDAAEDTWFARNHLGMATRNAWGAVAPFYVEMEGPQPPDGLPRAGALKVSMRNDHLQYAITWYGLALVVAVMFGFWIRGRYGAVDQP